MSVKSPSDNGIDVSALTKEIYDQVRANLVQELAEQHGALAERVVLLEQHVSELLTSADQLLELGQKIQALEGTALDTVEIFTTSCASLGSAARVFEGALKAGTFSVNSAAAQPPTFAAPVAPSTPSRVTVPTSARQASAPTAANKTRVAIPPGAKNQATPQHTPSPRPGFAVRRASLGVGASNAPAPHAAPPAPLAATGGTQGPVEAFEQLKAAMSNALGQVSALDPVRGAIAEAKLKQWTAELAAVGR